MSQSKSDIQALFDSAAEDGLSTEVTSILVNNLNTNTVAGAQGTPIDDLEGDAVTLYARVIDQSGSMDRFQQILIDVANKQIDALNGSKGGDQILMSTWFFNSSVRLLHTYLPLDRVPRLDQTTYVPNGYTALYDATLEAITSAVAYAQSLMDAGIRVKITVVILSDGEDNESHNSVTKVRTVVQDLLALEIYTISCTWFGPEGKRVAGEMGIPPKNLLTKDATEHDIRAAFDEISKSVIRTSQTVVGQVSNQGFYS